MSNYPVGAEYYSNAPFNKKELQGETIGLFEYLENLELPYEVRSELVLFQSKLKDSKKNLEHIQKVLIFLNMTDTAKLAQLVKNNISEPQIFIENE